MVTIGGHFSAVMGTSTNKLPGRYGYESGRSCLYALVMAIRPDRVHIPSYICSAIPDALKAAGCKIETYGIDDRFGISGSLQAEAKDLVLLTDYFGLTGNVVHEEVRQLRGLQVVVDCSQAYFQGNFECLGTFYSPRKFIPVPDGGFIETEITLPVEAADHAASVERFGYLLRRVGEEPESSRGAYLDAEADLERVSLRGISHLTRSIAETADLSFIEMSRRRNYRTLERLSTLNRLSFELGDQVPLCYPLMVENGAELRKALIGQRVFAPKFWPDVKPSNDFESDLVDNTVFLPLDHRYSTEDMDYVVQTVSALTGQRLG